MGTDLVSYLARDDYEPLLHAFQQSVEDAIIVRFPGATALLMRRLRQISDPAQLQNIHRIALSATDLGDIERAIDTALTA